MLSELKSAYQNQANDFKKSAQILRDQRKNLSSELVKGNISFDDFMQNAVNLEKLAQVYDQAAADFEQKSNTVNEQTIINLTIKNATNTLISNIRRATTYELEQEINKIVKTDVITRFLQNNGANDRVIDILIGGQVDNFLNQSGNQNIDSQELKDRLRDKIKDMIKDSKNDLRLNWNQRISEAIQQLATQMQSDTNKIENQSSPTNQPTPTKKPIPVDENGCKPGYHWDIKIGKCIQTNCNDVPNAHYSYVLDCVCGSSGSINENPDDPNKECHYPLNYPSCPGCVHTCVGLKQDCPE